MTQSSNKHDAAATALVSALGTKAVVVDGDTIVTVTEPLATTAGYEPDQLVGEPQTTLLRSTDTDRLELIKNDGSTTPVSVRRERLPTETDDREWTGLFITVVDSESSGATETVDLADTGFEQLFEAVNDAILVVDTDNNRITWANTRACELLGYSRQQLRSLAPKDIHPHEYDAFRSFVAEVAETGSGWTSSLSCYTRDGDVIPAEISGTRVTLEGRHHLLASIRDISTRADQREQLGRQAAAMKAATDGIAIYTAEGRVVYANHAYADLFGFDSPEGVVGRTWDDLHAEQQRFALGIASALSSTDEWRGEVTADGTDGSGRPLEASLTQLETDEVLCVAHDISAQQAYERRLTGLAAASRELLAAEDCGAVGAVAVDTVADVLDFERTCVRRYDEETNELAVSAISEAAERLRAEELAYDLNSSRAGTAFRRGETVRNEPGDDAYAEGSSRADLHVPIGEYGVLSVFEPGGSFTDQGVQLVELFAESVRAAFIQADREAQLRERREALESRTDELTVASRFNELVTELIGLMLRTPHRSEIERTVCDQLADSRLYEAAWIATVDDTDAVSVPTWSVDTEPFTETSPEAFVSSPFAVQLVQEAAETGAPTVTRRQFDSAGDTMDETLAAAVPIRVGSQRFGVLAVAGTDDQGFSETVRSGLRLLGETLGFAFVMEATRSTLVANDAIELEFALTERFAELSAALDCQCLYTGSRASETGGRTYCIRIQGASCEQVIARLDAAAGVSDTKPLDEWDDGCLVGVTVDDPVPELLADFGVNLRSLVASDGEARLVVEAPEDIDIAALRSALAEQYGSVRLVSKQHGRQDRSVEAIGDNLVERLTNKQLTVLETAAELGYYDWPREATAEDVADAVGIASSTLHQHLRAAEGKLVAAFFDTRS